MVLVDEQERESAALLLDGTSYGEMLAPPHGSGGDERVDPVPARTSVSSGAATRAAGGHTLTFA
jgi:hypothetical protein